MSKDTVVVYVCKGPKYKHVMPAYVYHDGIPPIIATCHICGAKMEILDKTVEYNRKQSMISAIVRKPCKEEYESYTPSKQRAIKQGLLIIDPFMASSSVFRNIRVEEIDEFRNWALVNHTPGDRVRYGIHHPVVTYECQRMNDEAVGWSV